MTSRTVRMSYITREEADCIAFDAELDAYLDDGDIGGLLDAACEVAGSPIGMDPKRAFAVAELTGARDELLVDYDDASRAVRRWFALMAEPGARH
jgi:hypothetical protein